MPTEVQSPPPPPYLSSKSNMGASEQPKEAARVDTVVRAFQNLTTDSNYKLVSDVFNEVIFLKEQNNNLRVTNRTMFEDYRDFRNELEEREKHRKTDLDHEKKALEARLAETEAELAEVTASRAKLTDEHAALTSTVEDKSKELATLAEQKAALEASLADRSKASDKLTGEKAKLTEEKTELEATIGGKDAELERLRLEKTTVDGMRGALELQASAKEKELADLHELKSKLEADLADVTGAKARLETDLDNAAARNNEQTKLLEEQTTKAEADSREISSLKAAIEERDTELAGVKDELALVATAAEEKAARAKVLEGELKEMASAAGGQMSRIETLEGELNVLTTTAKEAKDRVEFLGLRLSELDGLRVPLRSEPEDTYVEILDTIWTSIAGLVETQFRQDLEQSVLSDESCWTNLKPHARLIPLPQSNSPAAKQMRVAAVLAILSRALHRYIFRPVYLTENGLGDDGLVQMLRAIAVDSAAREEHTRATLLAMLPEKQKSAAAKRVSTVVREVSYAVQHLLNALQYETFLSGLEQACKLACVQWMRIQLAQMKIEPYFGPPFDDFDWQVLPLPAFSGEGVRLHSDSDDQEGVAIDDTDALAVETGRPVHDTPLTPRSRGGRVVDQEDAKSFRSSPHSTPDYQGDSEVGPDEIILVVWPSMCAVEHGELESITQGLVISKDQVRAATDEVRGRGRQRPGAKRARTLSMPGRGVSGQVGKAFLPQGTEPRAMSNCRGGSD